MIDPMPLVIKEVTVQYPNGTIAVHKLTLKVLQGEIFGLVGPNGAGKSSLLKCAAGLIKPTVGEIFCGEEKVTGDPCKTARFLSLMPDPLGVYNDVTALEYLEFFARALQIPAPERKSRIFAVVTRSKLEPWLDHEVETLSAGWQRRLALARILLADSPILLLDEPAAGLDVSARSSLLETIRSIKSEGKTVIVTSHILPELEQLCDRFGIIQNGSWVEVQKDKIFFTRENLIAGFGQGWILQCSDSKRAKEILGNDKAENLAEANTLLLKITSEEEAAAIVSELVSSGIKVYRIEPHSTGLSEFTLKLLKDGRE